MVRHRTAVAQAGQDGSSAQDRSAVRVQRHLVHPRDCGKAEGYQGLHGVAPRVGRGADLCQDGPMPSLVEGLRAPH